MNKNDFRIGNLVDFRGQVETIYQIKNSGVDFFRGKTKNGVIIQSYIWDAIQPIPLTEEWLLKFGFEIQDNNWKTLDLIFATLSWERLAGLTLSFKEESVFLPHIKYVHELQNFYFALVGKELVVSDAVS